MDTNDSNNYYNSGLQKRNCTTKIALSIMYNACKNEINVGASQKK